MLQKSPSELPEQADTSNTPLVTLGKSENGQEGAKKKYINKYLVNKPH